MQRSHALDHIRALAAFLVFCWHFLHWTRGYPVPFDGAPTFPLAALIDEGHVGVAVFMCLSGYLFAQLLDGKQIDYPRFMLARIVRLGPLLVFALVLHGFYNVWRGRSLLAYLKTLAEGLVTSAWPAGGWSIATEMHFYLLLPFILAARRKSGWALPAFLLAAITLRAAIFAHVGAVWDEAYWTIIGRIDQFLLGIVAFDLRHLLRRNHVAAVIAVAILGFGYYLFDAAGGWERLDASPIWIVWPTFEAVTISTLVGWYATSFRMQGRMAAAVGTIGFYSYGIYLLHVLPVYLLRGLIDRHILPLGNFYVAAAVAVPCFIAMVPIAALAYGWIEAPFQRFKPGYVRHQLTLRQTSTQPEGKYAKVSVS